jgi:hypothetical protein
MNDQELDQLKAKNEERIKVIEANYFAANAQILTAKEIMQQQQETFEIKEKFKDQSINYPNYGRGIKLPGIELNTFMVQEKMCDDPTKKKKQTSNSGSPQANVQAQQRKRILSPRRQRYETKFETFVQKKDVIDKLDAEDCPILEFDTQTKPEGTQNAKVNNKLRFEAREAKRIEEEQAHKSLPLMEKEAIEILHEEVVVVMGKDMINKLKEVFDSSKERGREHIDEVETAEFISNIAEDQYFESQLATFVRENVDGQKETLENLLHRVLKNHKEPVIQWHTFLGFFTKRGKLRDNEKVNL